MKPIREITPVRGWMPVRIGELWRYRDLLLTLVDRDVKLRYKQTALGVSWVILQPLIAALIFAVIFGEFANLPSDGVDYVLFSYMGLLGWTYVSNGVTRASSSLVGQQALITKVYFPRVLLPLASALSAIVDFSVAFVVGCALLIFYHVPLTWQFLTMPLWLVLISITISGIGLWISALSVYYRDFIYVLPFVVQVWLYITPVTYAVSLIPEKWLGLYSLNPMVGCIEGIRWAMLGTGELSLLSVIASIIIALALCLTGLALFHRVEYQMADVI